MWETANGFESIILIFRVPQGGPRNPEVPDTLDYAGVPRDTFREQKKHLNFRNMKLFCIFFIQKSFIFTCLSMYFDDFLI